MYQNINDEKQTKGEKPKDFSSQMDQQQQQGQKDFVPKYKLPTKIDEWIQLQFSKEFLEKVKQSEDFNFMGKFVFEKAELTFYYVGQLIEMFQESGLHSHTVPLYIFQRFISHEILSDHYLSQLTEFKFARTLAQLSFHSHSEQILSSHNLQKFSLSSQELRESISRVESSRIQHIAQNDVVQLHEVDQQATPLIISTPHSYVYWKGIAKELLLCGEITRAGELLEQVNQQAKIVKDVECVGEVVLIQAWIAQIQGNFRGSAVLVQQSHKWIKKVELWEQNALITFKTLYKLKKTNDIKAFLNKLINMFTSLSEEQAYSYNIISIKFAISTFEILKVKLYFKSLQQNFSYSKFKKGCTSIDEFIKNLTAQGTTKNQLELLLKSIYKLSIYLEQQNYADFSIVEKCYRIFDKLIKYLEIFEEKVKSLLKYTMLLEKQTDGLQGPLNITYNQIKLLISKLEINKGILNLIQRSVEYTEWREISMPQSQLKDQEEDKDEELEEKLDKVNEMKNSNFEPLNRYLAKLTQQIEMALLPLPKKLVSFERAIAILISLIPKIGKNNQQQFLMAKLEFARANRYLALSQGELKELWLRQGESLDDSQILKGKNDEDDDDDNMGFNVDYQLQSFQSVADILENNEFCQLVDNVLVTPNAFYNSAMFAEEVMENFGNKFPETTMEFLLKYQHFKNSEMFKRILKKSAKDDYKPHLLLNMNKFIYNNYLKTQNQDIENSLKQFKIWTHLYSIQDYKEIIREVIPTNSSYLSISLSPNKQAMYVGFLIVNKKRDTPIELFKRQLNKNDWDILNRIIQGINKIKQVTIKTPIITNEEHKRLIDEQNKLYQVLFSEFEEFCKFFTPVLDKIINSPMEDTEPAEEQQPLSMQKKAAPAPKKKGLKDELPAYDSPLKATLSGIDNLVVLLDHELMSLPFEFLQPFNLIPAKSRDFSLFLLAKRYKNIQFNSQLNNSIGIQKDKLKYVIYDFKQQQEENQQQMEINVAQSLETGMKPGGKFANLKFQGNTTSQRIASIGEWQKYLSSASGLLFYGFIFYFQLIIIQITFVYSHPSILDILSPKLFTDLLEINETKAFIVLDRINAIKTLIEKQSSLDLNSDKIPVIEQPLMTFVLLSLLGASSIAINQWSIHPAETSNTLKSMLAQLNQQLYFSATLNQYKEPAIVYLDKDGNQLDTSQGKDDKLKKPPSSQSKKGAKPQLQQQQQQQDQSELQKQEQFKKLLELHHVAFMGVPIIRLS